MPLRIFLISSTWCTPSAGFGLRGLMYRSRCRPKLEDVKAWLQNGHLRSLDDPVPFALSVSACDAGEDGVVSACCCFTPPSAMLVVTRRSTMPVFVLYCPGSARSNKAHAPFTTDSTSAPAACTISCLLLPLTRILMYSIMDRRDAR